MVDLLFNPNGRIGRNRFWQGMVVLTIASVLVAAAAWLLHPSFNLLNYALIFPYVCVYGKRLHDTGQTAWWVIAIWFVSFLFQVILLIIFLFTLLPMFMTSEQIEIWNKIIKYSEQGDTVQVMQGLELLMEETEGLMQRTAMFLLVIVNAAMAVILGAFKTQPQENKHGPVPGVSADHTFQ